MSLDDDERLGRPCSSTTGSHVELVRKMVDEDARVSIREIASTLDISFGSAQSILTDQLNLSKISARWVPRQLSQEQKKKRVQACQELLKLRREEGEAFSKNT